ncbi:MAG TPA: MEDS domain-containing protein [Candidatus Thermoplasmatota archaeon]|nr:MEDS domain-containing protein [Candidatus Thermoplasmatota archaeon]
MVSLPPVQSPPVHLCGRKLEASRHTCCFFNGRDEEYSVMAPFVKEGLDQGEQVVQIVGRSVLEDHDERLSRAGVRVEEPRTSGQYNVVTSEDAYLQGGHFDVDRTLKTLESLLHARREAGYPQLRVTGNMEWALQPEAGGTERLLEYESRVNLVSAQHRDPFVCFYDIHQFDAPTLMDVMRSHPAVIIGGVYHENPFYVTPERMLTEIRARPSRVRR